MTTLIYGSEEYERLLSRKNELDRMGNSIGLTGREYIEFSNLERTLTACDAAHELREQVHSDSVAASQMPFAMIAEDFEEMARYGDYGGFEG